MFDFHDLRNNLIQEIPVMADYQNGTLILGEITFEPGNACNVKMVGRLVEDDQIRAQKQQSSERNTGFLASRKSIDRFVEFVLMKAETFDNAGHLGAERIPVFLLKGMVEPFVFLIGLVKRVAA